MCIMKGVVQWAGLGVVFRIEVDGLITKLLTPNTVNLFVSLAVLVGLVTVVIYVIGKIRAKSVQKEPTASELMSKFRELHSRGDLSDSEFRTIKTTLAARLQEELKDTGQTG